MARQRLIQVLRDRGLGSNEAKRAMGAGKVFHCGVPTSDGGRMVEPESVEHRPNAPRIKPGRDLAILFHDRELAVVWKPSGLLSVPAGKQGGHKNVIGLVRSLLGQGLAVHRLDEPTSGVMMVARTEQAQLALKAQLEAHTVERAYLALAQGKPQRETWTMDTRLVRNRGDGKRGSIGRKGRHAPRSSERSDGGDTPRRAVTHFALVEAVGRRASLIEARLHTGRTHQVRIHLSEQGHPVLGDPLYGGTRAMRISPRLALHAAVLGFEHPGTGKQMRFETPLADDLEQLRRALIAARTVGGRR